MSLRARILLIFVLSGAAGALSLLWWMSSELEPRYLEAQEDLMVDISQMLAQIIEAEALIEINGQVELYAARVSELLEGFPDRSVEAQIYVLRKTGIDLRVYVADRSGHIVFDSDDQRALGEDYSEWRDVRLTFAGEYGARSSHDDPLFPEGSVMYAAAPIRHTGNIIGSVSVGKPTRNAERFQASAVRRFLLAAALAAVATLLVALILYRWVSLPLHRLYSYARELEAGRRVSVPRLGRNEIGRIGRAMADLRSALDGKTYIERYTQALTHELKSPTAAISGAAELLQEEDLPAADRARFIANIKQESQRLQTLIDRVLELAALENRPALEAAEPVQLESVIADALDGLAPLLQNHDITLDKLLQTRMVIRGEAFLLRLALDNLLKNAIEFSPVGGHLRVRSKAVDGVAVVTITDDGPGIPDYAQARVFERFYSLPRPDGRKGTGLGLNFVREICALHGGKLSLDRADSGGTIATITLPVAGHDNDY